MAPILIEYGGVRLCKAKFHKNAVKTHIGHNERRVRVAVYAEVHFPAFLNEILHRNEGTVAGKKGSRFPWNGENEKPKMVLGENGTYL